MPDVDHILEWGFAGASAAAGAGWAVFIAPRSCACGRLIWRGSRDLPGRVALSFDDGPTMPATGQILDKLKALDVKATFFVIGRNVERHPELVRRMDEEGHQVANHTLDHETYGWLKGRAFWDRQLMETDALVEGVIGKRPAMFRPPMGHKTWWIHAAARRRGQVVVTWTRRALDGLPTTTERILGRLVSRARSGDILALHDGTAPGWQRDPQPTIDAVEPLVIALRGRGLQIVRLDELTGRPAYRNG